jgi:hypothetical protein
LISEALAPVSASSSIDSNTDRLDMSGYDGVVFITPIEDSASTGVATLTVEANTVDSDSGMVAITGAAAAKTCVVNDDINGKLLIVDVYRPLKRYVQGVLTSSAANIAYGTTIAIRYRGRKAPVTADTTVATLTAVAGS